MMMNHNKCPISASVIHFFIKQTSLVLLNYAGSIYLNLARSIKDVEREYNKTIRTLNHNFQACQTCAFNRSTALVLIIK